MVRTHSSIVGVALASTPQLRAAEALGEFSLLPFAMDWAVSRPRRGRLDAAQATRRRFYGRTDCILPAGPGQQPTVIS